MTDTASPLRARALAWALVCAAMALACAVSVPPSGGPEDRTPPRVLETTPALDSAGVAADSDIRITFNEDMTRRGVERNIEFSPAVEIGEVRWDGRTLVVRPESRLHPDTTYLVTLKPGIQDNHRVGTKEEFRFAFATSAAIDTGRVEGRVLFRREPTASAVVHCYLIRDTVFVPAATRPERRVAVGENGNFALDYLDVGGVSYVLWAFEDSDKNGRFTPDREVGYAGTDTVTLTPNQTVAGGVVIAIVDPNEPALVRGRVINESGVDTMRVSVALYPAADTLADADSPADRAAYYTACDTSGAYALDTVRAGMYILRAFVDMQADSLCGDYPCGPDSSRTCVEPCVTHPDTVRVDPGDELEMRPVELQPAPAQGAP